MRRVSCVSMGCVRDPLGWINEGLCSQKGGRSDSHLRAVVRPRDADAKELEMPKNPRMGCSSRSERRGTRTEGEIRSSGSSASCFADIAPMSTSPRSKCRESGGALFVVYRLSQNLASVSQRLLCSPMLYRNPLIGIQSPSPRYCCLGAHSSIWVVSLAFEGTPSRDVVTW